MESHAFSKIDLQRFRARFRYDLDNPGYTRRTITRDKPRVISDFRPTPELSLDHLRTRSSPVFAHELGLDKSSSQETVSEVSPSPLLQANIDSEVLAANIDPLPKVKRNNRLQMLYRSKLQLGLTVLAVAIVLTGGYMSLVGFQANHIAVAQADKLTHEANVAVAAGVKPPANVIATTKPTVAATASYTVAPNLPKYLIIPELGVHSRVLSVGVNSSGALKTPNNVYDTAWYNASAEPGQPGAMLIDGHVSSWTAHGVFYGIKDLVPGNLIKVERGDGTIFTYSVVKNQVYPSGSVDMQSAVTPIVAGQPGLNLITCTGDVIPGTSLYNERIVVYATLQQ